MRGGKSRAESRDVPKILDRLTRDALERFARSNETAMLASTFRRIVTMDAVDFLEQFLRFLEEGKVSYCVIGGQAVNAYVDPLVSLDLDVVVGTKDLEDFSRGLGSSFEVAAFPHSLNVSLAGSDLRIQVQTDPRYVTFIERAKTREVLGRRMRVADITDVLQGKIWAATDAERRGSKRQKDLADISRIIEAYPELRAAVPDVILSRLI